MNRPDVMPESVWQRTDAIPGSFTRTSGEAFFEHALTCTGAFVEVGVDQGRSASLLMAAVEFIPGDPAITLIDSWESVLIDNMTKVRVLVDEFPNAHVDIWNMKSEEAAGLFYGSIGFLHIDANHYTPNPDIDCRLWLPKIRRGGIACFHDYGDNGFNVTEAVDRHTAGWEDLGVYDSLAIRRKR